MHKNGASEAPRTHFRARKSSKFPRAVPPDPLPQSMLWAPHFVFALGPSHPLGGPAPNNLRILMKMGLQISTSGYCGKVRYICALYMYVQSFAGCLSCTCNRRWLTQLVVFQLSEQAICTADCKSLATKPAEQWKTTIDLPRMNLIIFPASASPTSLFKHNQLWFSTVQLVCCKTLAICCN